MPNPRFSTQDWYCHPANERSKKEVAEVLPASQIPGLSHLPDDSAMEMEDDRAFKRKWIRDTDSKYVRLAKGGGRHDLLTFRDPKPRADEAKLYPRVDWFDHEYVPEDEEATQEQDTELPQKPLYRVLPEWYVHDHKEEELAISQNIPGVGRRRQQPPENTTKSKKNILSWRESKQDANNTQPKLPPLKHKKEKRQTKPVQEPVVHKSKHAVKLPPVVNEPVEFHHLMSMGYQQDWFMQQRADRHQQRKEKEEQKKESHNKRVNQMTQAIQMRKPRHSTTTEDKPLFKLSKFQNVQPRVESFRL